jgi:hypothetical protein
VPDQMKSVAISLDVLLFFLSFFSLNKTNIYLDRLSTAFIIDPIKLHIKQESQPRTNFKDTHQKILSSCLAGILCVQQQDENGSPAVS